MLSLQDVLPICRVPGREPRAVGIGVECQVDLGAAGVRVADAGAQFVVAEVEAGKGARVRLVAEARVDSVRTGVHRRLQGRQVAGGTDQRSEEHTSELQSLMRISYAVFCLKKKIKNRKQSHTFSEF